MKKLILLFLALGMAASSWAYDFAAGGIFYNITDATNKTVEVTYSSIDSNSYTNSVTIPSSVANTNSGTKYTVTAIGDSAFLSSTINDISIPTTVTKIGKLAFKYCWNLKSLTIPNSVTSIAYGAFYCCPILQTINLSASVTNIGSLAFVNCYILTNITVDASNSNYSSSDGVLFNKNQTKLIAYPEGKVGTYTVPSTVKELENESFMGNTNLTSITLPSALTSIGDSAFEGCTGLTSLSIPNTVTYIGVQAFSFCRGLTSITIPNSVVTIGEGAFSGCSSATTVTIPASVTSIGKYAFNSSNLSAIYVLNATPVDISSSTGVFFYVNKTTCVLHVPAGSKSLYQAANQWKDFSIITENTSGLYSASASQAKIMVTNGNVLVEGANAGTSITIYNLQGTAIYTGKTSGETESITLPLRGVYIVRVGSRSVKVVY